MTCPISQKAQLSKRPHLCTTKAVWERCRRTEASRMKRTFLLSQEAAKSLEKEGTRPCYPNCGEMIKCWTVRVVSDFFNGENVSKIGPLRVSWQRRKDPRNTVRRLPGHAAGAIHSIFLLKVVWNYGRWNSFSLYLSGRSCFVIPAFCSCSELSFISARWAGSLCSGRWSRR